jgi:hypothetical protein
MRQFLYCKLQYPQYCTINGNRILYSTKVLRGSESMLFYDAIKSEFEKIVLQAIKESAECPKDFNNDLFKVITEYIATYASAELLNIRFIEVNANDLREILTESIDKVIKGLNDKEMITLFNNAKEVIKKWSDTEPEQLTNFEKVYLASRRWDSTVVPIELKTFGEAVVFNLENLDIHPKHVKAEERFNKDKETSTEIGIGHRKNTQQCL